MNKLKIGSRVIFPMGREGFVTDMFGQTAVVVVRQRFSRFNDFRLMYPVHYNTYGLEHGLYRDIKVEV